MISPEEVAGYHAARPGITEDLLLRLADDTVTASMCLMLVAPLEQVLGEAARVLGPGGAATATVPFFDRSVPDPVLARVVAALGRPQVRYPETLDPAALPGRFRGAGLRLAADDTRVFRLPLPDAAAARLLAASFYAPGADAGDRERAAAAVPVGPACTAAYPLRRLVAVRG